VSAAPAQGAGLKGDVVLLLITAFWGLTFVTVKDALGDADPFSFLALRFGVGAVAATAIAGRQLLVPANVRAGLVLSGFLFLGYALQTWGLDLTTPSRSAFITGLAVVLVPFVSTVLFRRWPKVPSMVGVALAVVGLWLLTGGAVPGVASTRTGDLLTFGCAVSYAFHISLTEKMAPGRSATAMVAVQLWVVALASAACLPFVQVRVVWTTGLVGAVLFCGLFASALAISVQMWAQARTTAVRAALIYSLEPVFAVGYSVLAGRERLGSRELAGGTIIVAGVLVAEVGAALLERWRRRVAAA
jgi:drug/metabolite transporter (DMT)-like permease